MNKTIVPALMPKTYEELETLVASVVNVAPMVQFDIMDGHFVPGKTWPFTDPEDVSFLAIMHEEEDMPFSDKVSYELDLMVNEPGELLSQWQAMQPASIIIHLESCSDPLQTLQDFQVMREETSIGISFGHDIGIASLEKYLPLVDSMQCMGIAEIGKQGEPFAPHVIKQITQIKKYFPQALISVDGSVNKETIEQLADAGAQRLVVGSAIFGADDPAASYRELSDLL